VLAGAFRFAVASSEVIAEPGSFLFVPRGTAHTWTNAAETASTMLLTFVPGGMKPFFDEAAPYHARPPARPRRAHGHQRPPRHDRRRATAAPRPRTRRPPGAVTT
jgi:hypothetical protein